MKIIYRRGSLFDCEESLIAHGCNAQGKMGKGIALGIKNRFRFAYNDYVKSPKKLGTVIRSASLSHLIYNCITQQNYGNNPNIQYVDYDAVRSCIKFISDDLHLWKNDPDLMRVAMPRIGSSLGNGDWSVIENIIEQESKNFTPVVYIL